IKLPGKRSCGRSQTLFYNTERPYGSLGYKPPAPEVFIPVFAAPAAAHPQPQPVPLPALAQRPTAPSPTIGPNRSKANV
ncbi:MAG: hypothetical protein WAK01_03750, partial [Methylocystis sp.]